MHPFSESLKRLWAPHNSVFAKERVEIKEAAKGATKLKAWQLCMNEHKHQIGNNLVII